ncbi:MAG TPA: HIT domain-containing protein [Acidimicrobiales bacterium]|nr:HIT domain-containing protein [Acidimicrobiales bacterium]
MGLERFSAAWREGYVTSVSAEENAREGVECVFCVLGTEPVDESTGVLRQSQYSYVVLNAFPYGSGHLLVVPRRHVDSLEELEIEEYSDLFLLMRDAVTALKRAYEPDGMNLGLNLGHAAGAGIPKHLHAHALPRWNGDTNFMTTIGETRVLPESLQVTWQKVHAHL